jgi:hypothetical protein
MWAIASTMQREAMTSVEEWAEEVWAAMTRRRAMEARTSGDDEGEQGCDWQCENVDEQNRKQIQMKLKLKRTTKAKQNKKKAKSGNFFFFSPPTREKNDVVVARQQRNAAQRRGRGDD